MSTLSFVIFAVIIVAVNVLAFYFLSRREAPKSDDSAMKLLLEQMNNLSRTVDTKIGETTKEVGSALRHQFGESAKLIKEVTEGLTKLDETNRQVVSFTDQLQSLQDITDRSAHVFCDTKMMNNSGTYFCNVDNAVNKSKKTRHMGSDFLFFIVLLFQYVARELV